MFGNILIWLDNAHAGRTINKPGRMSRLVIVFYNAASIQTAGLRRLVFAAAGDFHAGRDLFKRVEVGRGGGG